jgi:hypothetical protein
MRASPVSPYEIYLCNIGCYDMEVGENRVRVFYGTEKREKEKDSRYIQEASAPAAEPCIKPVTCLRHKYTCNIGCCMGTLHCELQLRLQSQARLLALKQLVFRLSSIQNNIGPPRL